jgi:hypothetical protein
MRSGSHVQLVALRNRDLELQTTSPFSNLVIMDQWNGQQSAVAIKFCWIFSIFVGSFKSSLFCVTLCMENKIRMSGKLTQLVKFIVSYRITFQYRTTSL